MKAPDLSNDREVQISKALALLEVKDLPWAVQARWRHRIEMALNELEEVELWSDIARLEHSKEVRLAWQAYHRAAQRLLNADKKLRRVIGKHPVSPGTLEQIVDPQSLQRAIDTSAKQRRPHLRRKVIDGVVSGFTKAFEKYRKEAERQQWGKDDKAVQLAHYLLRQRRLPIETAVGSAWWHLARVLLGRDVNLFQRMRRYAAVQNSPRNI
jgi:hypothetical protein